MPKRFRIRATLNHIGDCKRTVRFNYSGLDRDPGSAGPPRGYARLRAELTRRDVNTRWPADCDGFTVSVTRKVAEQLARDQLGGIELVVTVRMSKYAFREAGGREVRGVKLLLENLENT
jgi:hypothetical protein